MKKEQLDKTEKMWLIGRQRPVKVVIASLFISILLVLFCGGSLWIPVSRLNNVFVKNMLNPVVSLAAKPGKMLGLDEFIPNMRLKFVNSAGLSENANWDTQYFNHKQEAQNLITDTEVTSPAADIVATKSAGEDVPPTTTGYSASTVYSAENPLKLYIFGDSQITGLGAGFDRLTKNISAIDADHLGIISSGFVRDEYYNWSAKLADVTAAKKYDAAVFMLGMNDNIDILDANNKPMYRGTAEWEAYYSGRCTELLDQITSEFSKVYWLGMPCPRNSKYDEHLLYIDAIHEKLAAQYDPDVLVRVSIRDIFPGKDKKYRDNYYFSDGKVLRVMGDDGIHLTIAGGQWVMDSIYKKITNDFSFKTPLPAVVLPD